jgi:Tfp pilus assembly protein PilN
MKWIRQNAGWMAAVLTLLGAGATGYLALYVRSALAAPEARITALETHQIHNSSDLSEIKRDAAETRRKVDEIHGYLLGGKQ